MTQKAAYDATTTRRALHVYNGLEWRERCDVIVSTKKNKLNNPASAARTVIQLTRRTLAIPHKSSVWTAEWSTRGLWSAAKPELADGSVYFN